MSENEKGKSGSSRKNKGSKKNEKGELRKGVRSGKPEEKVTVSV